MLSLHRRLIVIISVKLWMNFSNASFVSVASYIFYFVGPLYRYVAVSKLALHVSQGAIFTEM